MRLLNTHTLALSEFADDNVPRYAILSHTWADDEVTLREMQDGHTTDKKGYYKIYACCSVARDRGFEHIWIDTCCIDKTSSAELSEAINSMFRWYQDAAVCLAFLADVPTRVPFRESRWFTRGWTLQELIAPPTLVFFGDVWQELGTRDSLRQVISDRTRIPLVLLSGHGSVDTFSVAQKMSWAAGRQTTRVEDRSYSLLGIFGINMPLIYGERETAFIRLQEEIMKISDDHSLFAWRLPDHRGGLLAASPDCFLDSGSIVEFTPPGTLGSNPWTVSGRGIHLEVRFVGISPRGIGLAILNCKEKGGKDELIGIYVRDPLLTMTQFERVRCHEFQPINVTRLRLSQCPLRRMWIRKGGRASRGEKKPGEDSHEHEDKVPLQIPTAAAQAHRTYRERQAALLGAVEQAHAGGIWLLLTRNDFQHDLRQGNGRQILSWAVERGDEAVLQVLLARNEIDADAGDENGRTLLLKAAAAGRAAVLRLLLASGRVEVEAEDEAGRTSLSLAAENGDETIVRMLLERGANIQTRDILHGQTPLSWAVERGHEAVVRLLLDEGGADVQTTDRYGRSPLIWAINKSYKALVELLLEKEADITIRDTSGRTPLAWAAEKGDDAVLRLLLEKGADVEARDNWGQTPLLSTAERGDETVVSLLLEHGASVEAKGNSGWTPLLWAAAMGHDKVVELLLEKGAKVEASNDLGRTVLSLADEFGHGAVVRLLLEKGATFETEDEYLAYGLTPIPRVGETHHPVAISPEFEIYSEPVYAVEPPKDTAPASAFVLKRAEGLA